MEMYANNSSQAPSTTSATDVEAAVASSTIHKTGKLATGANCVVTIADLSSKLRPIVPPLIIVSDAVEMSIRRERDGYECEILPHMYTYVECTCEDRLRKLYIVQWFNGVASTD